MHMLIFCKIVIVILFLSHFFSLVLSFGASTHLPKSNCILIRVWAPDKHVIMCLVNNSVVVVMYT